MTNLDFFIFVFVKFGLFEWNLLLSVIKYFDAIINENKNYKNDYITKSYLSSFNPKLNRLKYFHCCNIYEKIDVLVIFKKKYI